MSYSIEYIEGIRRLCKNGCPTDKFVTRDEKSNRLEIREMSYDDDDDDTPLVFSVSGIYNEDVLLLAYTAFRKGVMIGIREEDEWCEL